MYQTIYKNTRKLDSRYNTIIKYYRDKYKQSLPIDKQYYSICAQCSDEEGNIIEGCELHQLLDSSFIAAEQFHGIDIDPEVYNLNTKNTSGAHWYNGSLIDVIAVQAAKLNFNPGVINIDTLNMPKRGVKLLADLLFLTRNIPECMYVGNFILFTRGKYSAPEEIINCLNKEDVMKYVDIEWDGTCYLYGGSFGDKKTLMGTIILYRKNT